MSRVEITCKQNDPFLVWVAQNIDAIVANGLYVKLMYSDYLSLACDDLDVLIQDDIGAMKKLLLKREHTTKKPMTTEDFLKTRNQHIVDHDAQKIKSAGTNIPVKPLEEHDLKAGHATFRNQLDDMIDYQPSQRNNDMSMDPNAMFQ
jgi:hypothetical protein